MKRLAIAGLQLEFDEQDNLPLIERELRKLRKRLPWVEMAMLPELATHGVSTTKVEKRGGPTEQKFRSLAKELDLWLVPGSLFQRQEDKVYNATPVIDPCGNVVARYAKMFPFQPYEQGVTPGGDYCLFDGPGGARIGLTNCYDMWFPETTRTLAARGAEIILHPSLTSTIDRDVEKAIARANAAICQVWFFDLNTAGKLGLGGSTVHGPGGECIYEAGSGRDIVALDINLSEVAHVRRNGWHGLGQMMKSFRDSEVEFPVHGQRARKTEYLDTLGPLEIVGRKQEILSDEGPARRLADEHEARAVHKEYQS